MKNFVFCFLIMFCTACTTPTFEQTGGTRIVLEAILPENASQKEVVELMDRVKAILAERLDKVGVEHPTIKQGETVNYIVVEIPGQVDVRGLRSLLVSSAQLEFWETYEFQELYQKISDLNTAIAIEDSLKGRTEQDSVVAPEIHEGMTMDEQFAAQKSESEKEEEKKQRSMKQYPVFSRLAPAYTYNERGVPAGIGQGPVIGTSLIKDTAAVNAMLKGEAAKKIFGRYVKFLWTAKPTDAEMRTLQLIGLRTNRSGKPAMWDNLIEDAHMINDDFGPQISMTLNKFAASDWQKLTRDNIGKSIAIVLDDKVYSYPIVNSEIEGGKASITGAFTVEEAQEFAAVLKAGSLPLRLSIIQEDQVAPLK